MRRFAAALSLTLFSVVGVPLVAGAEGEARLLGDDPRVADAIKVWEEWVEYQAAIDRVPGISVGVVHDQEVLATNAFGLANPDTGAAARPDTLYSICSISKLFTSVAVLQLRDAGKLSLGDGVGEHVEWFDIQDVHPNDEPITIRNILTHSSGLPRESDFSYWTGEGFPFPTRDEIMARVGEQQTLYPASRYFQYSNLGLTLAGEVVASASGRPFADYVQGSILDPLDMENTFTEVPKDLRGGRLAVGHSAITRDGAREVVAPFQARGIAAAAGFASNVSDLAKFASWQFRLLSKDESQEVLRASTLREMQRVQWMDPNWKTTRGLGFSIRRQKERTIVGHGGACPGYFSSFGLEAKSRVAIIVLSNAIGAKVGYYAAKGFALIAPAVGKSVENADDTPERDPDLDRYTGIYETVWGQAAIVQWEDGLAALYLDAREPEEALTKLKKTGENVFRRVRKDDKDQLGEEWFFDEAEDGTVTRLKVHSNWSRKVR